MVPKTLPAYMKAGMNKKIPWFSSSRISFLTGTTQWYPLKSLNPSSTAWMATFTEMFLFKLASESKIGMLADTLVKIIVDIRVNIVDCGQYQI